MCLILLAYRVHPVYPLILAANRDEFHARPTAPAMFWKDPGDLLAGRDLLGGGTWLGVNRSGRIAAVTNVREPAKVREGAPTRGALVVDFLRGARDPDTYVDEIGRRAAGMNGFNLLTGDAERLVHTSNRFEDRTDGFRSEEITAGIHGLSNAGWNTPWPKVERGRRALQRAIETEHPSPDALLALLADDEPAADPELPDTGVGLELERSLSSIRIRLPKYGTRSSTVVMVSADGHLTFIERTWPTREGVPESRRFRFLIAEATLA